MNLSQLIEKDFLDSKEQLIDDRDILCVCYRIEDVVPGCLFVCMRGQHANTHEMVSYIIAHGASAIIVDEEVKYPPQSNCLIIRTKSSRRALAYAFSAFSYHPQRKLKIYGITGTNGKTSTAVFLEAILRRAGLRTALIGTLGCFADGRPYTPKSLDAQKRLTTMTTPDPDILYPFLREIANLNITHVVMEVSSHALALEKVAPIHFEGAGFTNFSMEHMDFHLTPEAYLEAKRILFHQTKKAAMNIDDSAGEKIAKSISCPTLTCGIVWNADVMASEIEMLPNGTHRFMIAEEQTKDLISLSCLGEYQIYNALLAATMAKQACISGKAIREGIESVSSIPGRFEVISTPDDPVQICIDFAHTEASLRNLLKAARSILSGDGRLILVFGCGGDRDKTKRAPMGACAEELADFSIITSDNARTESPTAIISDILYGYRSADSRKIIVDRQKAIEYAIEIAHDGDCVLVVGKGHEQYEVRGGQILPFDERKIILNALKQRRNANTIKDTAI